MKEVQREGLIFLNLLLILFLILNQWFKCDSCFVSCIVKYIIGSVFHDFHLPMPSYGIGILHSSARFLFQQPSALNQICLMKIQLH